MSTLSNLVKVSLCVAIFAVSYVDWFKNGNNTKKLISVKKVPRISWSIDRPFADYLEENATPLILENSVVTTWDALSKWSSVKKLAKFIGSSRLENIFHHQLSHGQVFGPFFDSTRPFASLNNVLPINPYETDASLTIKEMTRVFGEEFEYSCVNESVVSQSRLSGCWAFSGSLMEVMGDEAMIEPLEELLKLNPSASSVNLWIGQRGITTPCHFDGYHNMYVQIAGSKRFVLYPPSDIVHLRSYPFLHVCNIHILLLLPPSPPPPLSTPRNTLLITYVSIPSHFNSPHMHNVNPRCLVSCCLRSSPSSLRATCCTYRPFGLTRWPRPPPPSQWTCGPRAMMKAWWRECSQFLCLPSPQLTPLRPKLRWYCWLIPSCGCAACIYNVELLYFYHLPSLSLSLGISLDINVPRCLLQDWACEGCLTCSVETEVWTHGWRWWARGGSVSRLEQVLTHTYFISLTLPHSLPRHPHSLHLTHSPSLSPPHSLTISISLSISRVSQSGWAESGWVDVHIRQCCHAGASPTLLSGQRPHSQPVDSQLRGVPCSQSCPVAPSASLCPTTQCMWKGCDATSKLSESWVRLSKEKWSATQDAQVDLDL